MRTRLARRSRSAPESTPEQPSQMPRYAEDYQGIPARIEGARGMDPNHRDGGYRGMRMTSGPHQAAYGWHRWTHEGDFETSGGFRGRYGGGPARSEDRFRNSRPRYDADLRGRGGVHDWRYDTEYLRDFNADSVRFRDGGQWGGGSRPGEGGKMRSARRGYDTGFRWKGAERTTSEGGYGEPWVWGPMRGAR
jgi:hypothetical protein